MRSSAVGMPLVGCDGRWIETKPACERARERGPDNPVGRPWHAVLHPDERGASDQGAPEIDKLVAGRERRFLTPRGRTVGREAHASMLRRANGQVECYVTPWPDITAPKAADRGPQVKELPRGQRMTIDRETRVLEWKAENNALRARPGETRRSGPVGQAVPAATAGGKEAA